MSEFNFKVDDTFFKDNFDITGIEDKIYNQMAKTMARNVDIELAKTPLVDILTGYTRYKEAEYELQQKENIIKEYGDLDNHNKYLYEENKRLENIIKEVREYIKEQLCQGGERETRDLVDGNDILEILDKGE